MPEPVDLQHAALIADQAARLADDTAVLKEPDVAIWVERVHAFSNECVLNGLKSYIAALGTMMLAKAANARVDVFSLKPFDPSPGAFSARSVAHGCLVPAAHRHRFDLGASGREPLNNQPFFRAQRIDERMVVLDRARPTLGKFIALLRELERATSTEAVRALAGFIHVRRQYFIVFSTEAVDIKKEPRRRASSCFLSYARVDCDFAQHLRDGLRHAGITCWQDIHDMRGGDFWREQIYDAIGKHDRLILICSRASLDRAAVVEEIQEAIAREGQTGTRKLFPIRIDDFILSKELDSLARSKVTTGEWSENWVSRVRAYHIPDFSDWSTPERFRQEFQKLVEALNQPSRATGT